MPLYSTLDNFGASMNFAFDLSDALTLKSITSYRDTEWTGARDADNTPLTILHTEYNVSGDQFSQELQFTYETDPVVGVVGLYYFEQTSDDIATIYLNPPPPGVQLDSDNNEVDNSSWAAFTQWTFKFADRFAFTAGGRYTEDDKGSYPDQFDYATPNIKQVPVQWYRETFNSFTPSASFSVDWTDNAMTYLSYSEGFKGGGWNSHFNAVLTPAQQAALQMFEQEEAQTIELGAKFDFACEHDASQRRGVHFRLHRHAAHVSRTGAGRRRALHHQCGRDQHRWRRSRVHLGADGCVPDRCQRRIPGCDDRQSLQHSARGAAARARRRQLPAVRARVAGALGAGVHGPHRWT